MEAKDRIRFDSALTAPMPGYDRPIEPQQLAAETDGLKAMAAWAGNVQQGR